MLPIKEPKPRAEDRAVGVSHSGQHGTHGNIEHGVAAFVQDLAEEQNNQHGSTLEEGGHRPEGDCGDSQQRGSPQQPGTELALGIVVLGEHLVHQSAHQGIVNGIPDVPDQQQGCQNDGIDLQHVDIVPGHIGTHQCEGHAAAQVAHGVADLMLPGQAVLGRSICVFCHLFFRHFAFAFSIGGISSASYGYDCSRTFSQFLL